MENLNGDSNGSHICQYRIGMTDDWVRSIGRKDKQIYTLSDWHHSPMQGTRGCSCLDT